MALTGTIDERGVVEDVLFEDEKVEKEIQEQQQFEGTDGWGCIDVRYNDGGFNMQNVKWEIKDKFFHVLEKGKEAEEGMFIPLSKVVHFSFYYKAPVTVDKDKFNDDEDDYDDEDESEDPENNNPENVDDDKKTKDEDVPF